MTNDSMIHLSDVHKTYEMGANAVHALRDVDLDIGRGEYVALFGPSGSGKSTLMHIIGCLDTPSRGSYRLNGDAVEQLDRNRLAALRNRRVGFVFQAFHLMPRATALDNVALPLRFSGVPLRERRARAATQLEAVGLGDRFDHRPAELSGGQQQRVAIARALINEPDLVLADEPTGNLDSKSGVGIVELLEQVHAMGRTLVVVTHDEVLAQRARRRLRLLDGRVVADERQ